MCSICERRTRKLHEDRIGKDFAIVGFFDVINRLFLHHPRGSFWHLAAAGQFKRKHGL